MLKEYCWLWIWVIFGLSIKPRESDNVLHITEDKMKQESFIFNPRVQKEVCFLHSWAHKSFIFSLVARWAGLQGYSHFEFGSNRIVFNNNPRKGDISASGKQLKIGKKSSKVKTKKPKQIKKPNQKPNQTKQTTSKQIKQANSFSIKC